MRLKRPWSDGTSHIILSPLELVERLVALIPPPRRNIIRYHGVFSPRSKLRRLIVPAPVELQNSNGTKEPVSMGCAHRTGWAKLMARVFDIDVLACPKCGNEMQQIAFITQASVIRAILNSVGYGCDPPLAADA